MWRHGTAERADRAEDIDTLGDVDVAAIDTTPSNSAGSCEAATRAAAPPKECPMAVAFDQAATAPKRALPEVVPAARMPTTARLHVGDEAGEVAREERLFGRRRDDHVTVRRPVGVERFVERRLQRKPVTEHDDGHGPAAALNEVFAPAVTAG
jgi:hypothetical protein